MNDFDDLAAQAERGESAPVEGTARHGAAARERARQLLIEATGGKDIVEAGRIARGRPRLSDEGQGETVVWKVRAPEGLDAQVKSLSGAFGGNKSDLIRAAVQEYVRVHG
jgi:hypothetical protein